MSKTIPYQTTIQLTYTEEQRQIKGIRSNTFGYWMLDKNDVWIHQSRIIGFNPNEFKNS